MVRAAQDLESILAAEHALDVFIESLPAAPRIYDRIYVIDAHTFSAEGQLAFSAFVEVAN